MGLARPIDLETLHLRAIGPFRLPSRRVDSFCTSSTSQVIALRSLAIALMLLLAACAGTETPQVQPAEDNSIEVAGDESTPTPEIAPVVAPPPQVAVTGEGASEAGVEMTFNALAFITEEYVRLAADPYDLRYFLGLFKDASTYAVLDMAVTNNAGQWIIRFYRDEATLTIGRHRSTADVRASDVIGYERSLDVVWEGVTQDGVIAFPFNATPGELIEAGKATFRSGPVFTDGGEVIVDNFTVGLQFEIVTDDFVAKLCGLPPWCTPSSSPTTPS